MRSCSIGFSMVLLLSFHSLMAQSWQCGDSLLDVRDGQKYATVLVGEQCWMAQNLNIGTFIESIPNGTGSFSAGSNNDTIEKYCLFNDTLWCNEYGGLYDWLEMVEYSTDDAVTNLNLKFQGICPAGWHLPWSIGAFQNNVPVTLLDSTIGWGALESNYPVATAGIDLKDGGSSGFNATLGGYRMPSGLFDTLHFGGNEKVGIYWALNTSFASNCLGRMFWNDVDSVGQFYGNRKHGLSVRCVKDTILPVVSTTGHHAQPLDDRIHDNQDKQLLYIIDLLGRVVAPEHNRVLLYIYGDGSVEKKIQLQK